MQRPGGPASVPGVPWGVPPWRKHLVLHRSTWDWAWDLGLCTASMPLAVNSQFVTPCRELRTGDPL